jgi:hypothetical protein
MCRSSPPTRAASEVGEREPGAGLAQALAGPEVTTVARFNERTAYVFEQSCTPNTRPRFRPEADTPSLRAAKRGPSESNKIIERDETKTMLRDRRIRGPR